MQLEHNGYVFTVKLYVQVMVMLRLARGKERVKWMGGRGVEVYPRHPTIPRRPLQTGRPQKDPPTLLSSTIQAR